MYLQSSSAVFASSWQPMPNTVSSLCRNECFSTGEHQVPYLICNIDLFFFLLELFDAHHHEEMTKCNLIDLAQLGTEVD